MLCVKLISSRGEEIEDLEVDMWTIPPKIFIYRNRAFRLLPMTEQQECKPYIYQEELSYCLVEHVNYRKTIKDARK